MSGDWPFEDWLYVAVTRLGLSPQEFWALSVKDWRVLTRHASHSALRGSELEALCRAFPDIKKDM